MLEPAAEMFGSAPGSGPRQTLSAAMRPAAHHVIGDFWVELQPDRTQAVTIGLVGEIRPTESEEFGALREIEAVRMPLIDRAPERNRAQPVANERRLDRVIANLATLVVLTENPRAERSGQHLRPKAEAKQRFALGERSFEPLDLPSCPVERIICARRAAEHDYAVMVGQPIRQRLAATRPPNVKPDVQGFRAMPTRPGVECSWCRTINTVGRRARLPRVVGSNSIAACVRRLFELPPYVGKFRATS